MEDNMEKTIDLSEGLDSGTEIKPVGRTRSAKTIVESKPTLQLVSCLTNEKVHVNYILQLRGNITNPKHEYYGGMANTAFRIYTVPMNQFNGSYVQVLTDSEQAYLEEVMGLEYNALSVHLRTNNYWDNIRVRLTKGTNILNLADPADYIKYKVLLANKDEIAESIRQLQDYPKATYRFVLVKEGEKEKLATKAINATMQAYKIYGKYEDDFDTLKTIVELIEGKPVSPRSKLDFILAQINRLITQDANRFVQTASDELLPMKVLIKKAIQAGVISSKGNYLYMTDSNTPLCGPNQDPTLNVAAQYLALPKQQDLKFSIEAKLNK